LQPAQFSRLIQLFRNAFIEIALVAFVNFDLWEAILAKKVTAAKLVRLPSTQASIAVGTDWQEVLKSHAHFL
jgi:hypothetical protein